MQRQKGPATRAEPPEAPLFWRGLPEQVGGNDTRRLVSPGFAGADNYGARSAIRAKGAGPLQWMLGAESLGTQAGRRGREGKMARHTSGELGRAALGAARRRAEKGWTGAAKAGHTEEQRGRSAKQRDAHKGTDPRPRPRERPQPGQEPHCGATGPPQRGGRHNLKAAELRKQNGCRVYLAKGVDCVSARQSNVSVSFGSQCASSFYAYVAPLVYPLPSLIYQGSIISAKLYAQRFVSVLPLSFPRKT